MSLNLDDLKKYDPSGIHNIYDKWPEIAQEVYSSQFSMNSNLDMS